MSDFPRTFRRAFTKYSYIYPFMLLLVFVPIQWNRVDEDRDVYAYYLAAERARSGISLYDPHPAPGPLVIDQWYYLYPPFLGSALSLGPQMSFPTFARVWLLVLLSAYWVFAASIGRMGGGRTTLRGTLVAGAALQFVPGVANALNMGQADVLVWAMVGVALAYSRLRGMGLMAATLTKVFGIWPLLVTVFREPRQTIQGAGLVVGAAVLVALLALGPLGFLHESMDWFVHIVPALSQGQLESTDLSAMLQLPFGPDGLSFRALLPHNLSISFAPLLLANSLGGWAPDPGDLHIGLRLYLTTASVAAPLVAAWIFRKQPIDLHCALVLSAALLFAPFLRPTNLPLVLLPTVIFFGSRWRGHVPGAASPPPGASSTGSVPPMR